MLLSILLQSYTHTLLHSFHLPTSHRWNLTGGISQVESHSSSLAPLSALFFSQFVLGPFVRLALSLRPTCPEVLLPLHVLPLFLLPLLPCLNLRNSHLNPIKWSSLLSIKTEWLVRAPILSKVNPVISKFRNNKVKTLSFINLVESLNTITKERIRAVVQLLPSTKTKVINSTLLSNPPKCTQIIMQQLLIRHINLLRQTKSSKKLCKSSAISNQLPPSIQPWHTWLK